MINQSDPTILQWELGVNALQLQTRTSTIAGCGSVGVNAAYEEYRQAASISFPLSLFVNLLWVNDDCSLIDGRSGEVMSRSFQKTVVRFMAKW